MAPEHGDPAQPLSFFFFFFRTKDSTHTLSFKRGVVNSFTSALGPFYRPEVSHLSLAEFFSFSLHVAGFAGASRLREVLGENRPKMDVEKKKMLLHNHVMDELAASWKLKAAKVSSNKTVMSFSGNRDSELVISRGNLVMYVLPQFTLSHTCTCAHACTRTGGIFEKLHNTPTPSL